MKLIATLALVIPLALVFVVITNSGWLAGLVNPPTPRSVFLPASSDPILFPTRTGPGAGIAAPPTLVVEVTATPVPPSDTPTPTVIERVVIVNTGGIGAVLRASPASGRPVGSLREGQVLEVLERQQVNSTQWVHVRVPAGADGWVLATLAAPVSAAASAPSPPAPAAPPRTAPSAIPRPTPAARAGATQTLASVNRPAAATLTPSVRSRTHTVVPGDELKKIAAANGVSIGAIMAINQIPNPDSLVVGQVLQLPNPD